MSFYFLDSSALVKYYVKEKGTAWIKELLNNEANKIVVSKITGVEVTAAIAKHKRMKSIDESQYEKAYELFIERYKYRYIKVEVNNEAINSAMALTKKHPLRAYDAVQLSSVLNLRESLIQKGILQVIFICADNNLCDVAEMEGLTVDNPNNYD